MPVPPLRATTIKRFLKEQTGMRVGVDAIERMVSLLSSAAESIALQAKQQALEAQRNTLFEADIQHAFEDFLQSSGPTLLSSATIHAAIDGISNEALTDLINRIRADVRENP